MLALRGVPFAGVHAVRPIRAQQEVLSASFSGGVALANETRGEDDTGGPARPDARDAFSYAKGDEPIGLRRPKGWTRATRDAGGGRRRERVPREHDNEGVGGGGRSRSEKTRGA